MSVSAQTVAVIAESPTAEVAVDDDVIEVRPGSGTCVERRKGPWIGGRIGETSARFAALLFRGQVPKGYGSSFFERKPLSGQEYRRPMEWRAA